MKRTIYTTPQIYVVKLHQQALMQYASPATAPRVVTGTGTESESDTDWKDEYDNWNL